VLHVITGLDGIGGTEVALYRLLRGMKREKFALDVVVLGRKGGKGTIGDRIEKLGINVYELGVRAPWFGPLDFARLLALIRKVRPDVVQTWLYHPNVLAGTAARLCGVRRLIWNLRSSPPLPDRAKASRYWAFKLGQVLSSWLPDVVVSCSNQALRAHQAKGYGSKRNVVIPNGFELPDFPSNSEDQQSAREECGIKGHAFVIGMVARFHPDKDHRTFVNAACELMRREPALVAQHNIQFVLCGEGITWGNGKLAEWIDNFGLRSRFHLLGRQSDAARVMASFDIASLSSISEAFPNVVGEAMAQGIPCVVTDVGETGAVVGNTGSIVPASNPGAMAYEWARLARMSEAQRRQLGLEARERIRFFFSLRNTISAYEALYTEIARLP
jgi:glycosyltransferase involved in cell wall biosynthesis